VTTPRTTTAIRLTAPENAAFEHDIRNTYVFPSHHNIGSDENGEDDLPPPLNAYDSSLTGDAGDASDDKSITAPIQN
jgi:hypothetical protein